MKKKHIQFICIIALLLVVFCLSLFIGSYHLSFRDIMQLISGQSTDKMAQQVFYTLRFPRVMMGLTAGIVLGVAGAIYQMVFINPLASPDLTGVASGASLGAAFAIVLGAGTTFEMMLGSFTMSILALVFVIFLVKMTRTQHATTYILAGIIISALADAGIMIFKYMADPMGELAAIEFWTMGSLSAMTLNQMLIAIMSIMIPLILILLSHHQIVMLSLGDDNARYLGLNVQIFRIVVLILTTWMVASIVSLTGVISFVGLIAPHIAFLILKKRTGSYMLMSGFIGSLIIIVGDMLARCLVPGTELPLSILTIFFSTPVFIFCMIKQRGHIR